MVEIFLYVSQRPYFVSDILADTQEVGRHQAWKEQGEQYVQSEPKRSLARVRPVWREAHTQCRVNGEPGETYETQTVGP